MRGSSTQLSNSSHSGVTILSQVSLKGSCWNCAHPLFAAKFWCRFCRLEDRLTLFPNGCLQTLHKLHKLHKLQILKILRGRVHCHNSEIKMYDRRCKIWGNNKRTKDGPFDGLRVGHLMGHTHIIPYWQPSEWCRKNSLAVGAIDAPTGSVKSETQKRADGSRESTTDFFCLIAAWLNEGRCPGGRPSVSTN